MGFPALPGHSGAQNPVVISFSGFGDTEAACLSESTAAAEFPGALRSGFGSVWQCSREGPTWDMLKLVCIFTGCSSGKFEVFLGVSSGIGAGWRE